MVLYNIICKSSVHQYTFLWIEQLDGTQHLFKKLVLSADTSTWQQKNSRKFKCKFDNGSMIGLTSFLDIIHEVQINS